MEGNERLISWRQGTSEIRKRGDHLRESVIENEFIKAVQKRGGLALKFNSSTVTGVPDRLILFKIGKCAFVELKAPGKQMRPLQRKRRLQLEALGFPVFCVDRLEQIEPVIEALIAWNPGEPIPTGVGAKIPELKNVELPGAEFAPSVDVGDSSAAHSAGGGDAR